jgi:hypothetical protein
MSIRQLPIVGGPTNPPAPLRKIALEEHVIDPAQVAPNYEDSFSGGFEQSSYAGFTAEYGSAVKAGAAGRAAGRPFAIPVGG